MFDDQTNPVSGAGAPPANLPIGEPEDMFADAEPAGATPPPAPSVPILTPAAAPSAVDAGMLKPKMPTGIMPLPTPTAPMVHTPPRELTQSMEDIKEPKTAKRVMIIILILVGVAVLVAIIWFIFGRLTRFMRTPAPPVAGASSATFTPNSSAVPPADPSPAPAPDAAAPADDTILFGEPIDVDGDSLDQSREETIGTDPNNWDTDGDELSDGDEVIIWKTSPTNPDTDGDTYTDGSEVKNGYSPTGPGKLFQPPASDT